MEFVLFLNGIEQEKYLKKTLKTRKAGGKAVYGYDESTGRFSRGGEVLDDREMADVLARLNGRVYDPMFAEKLGNGPDSDRKKAEEIRRYWNEFKISMSGSKVGDVANFSLPPGISCAKGVPCLWTGCYAVKPYGRFPSTRTQWDVNLHLLMRGEFRKFEEQLVSVLNASFKDDAETKEVGADPGGKLRYFRFHVSGDVFSDEYFRSMCNVARSCPDVGFWTYTKQYEILGRCKDAIPDNLTVLVSCWGQYRPRNFMRDESGNLVLVDRGRQDDKGLSPEEISEKYPLAYLEDEFSLAYLDDQTDATRNYIDKEIPSKICPCTEYSDMEVHCVGCLKCYTARTDRGEKMNIIFNKH